MVKLAPGSDIDLDAWDTYPEVLTDSLWLFPNRDSQYGHSHTYYGSCIPQVPRQLITRFTKRGETVLDPFCGGGTALFEAVRLGRNAIGIDLNPEAIRLSRELLASAQTQGLVNGTCSTIEASSFSRDTQYAVDESLQSPVSLLFLHPPYGDIIQFTQHTHDISNPSNSTFFQEMLVSIIQNFIGYVKPGGHVALLIGDIYRNKRYVPLGFESLNAIQCSFKELELRAICVKDMQGNEKGKGKNTNLWRYRALANGLYVFKHEYVFLFRKKESA